MNTFSRDDRDRLIDRLVDGALPESDRQILLARLDADADGWRRCALAFLEAQAWREALGPVARSAAAEELPPKMARRGFQWVARLAVAAGVLGAFALGWLTRGGPALSPAPTREAPVVTRRPEAPPAVVPVALPVETPGPATLATSDEPEEPTLPDPVLDDWARQGFQVERRERVVSLGLDDGRRVPVPVSEVRLRYIGDRTY
jgi:hypothetical protein